jgi:hypothetical protein
VAEAAGLAVGSPDGRQPQRVNDTTTRPGAHGCPFSHCSG